MTLPNNQPPASDRSTRNAVRLSLLIIPLPAVILVLIVTSLARSPAWQLYLLAVIALSLIGFLTASIMAARRGNTRLSGWLILAAISLGGLIASLTITGAGALVSIIIILIAFIASTFILPRSDLRRAIAFSILAAALSGATTIAPLATQLTIPALSDNLPYLLGFAVLVFSLAIISQFSSYPLTIKLTVGFLTVTLLSLVILASVNNLISRTSLTQAANESLLAAAEDVANSLDDFFNRTVLILSSEAQLPALVNFLNLTEEERLQNPLTVEVIQTLNVLTAKDAINVSSYALLGLDGFSIYDTQSIYIGQDESGMEYFLKAIADPLRTHVSPVIIDPISNVPSIYFSRAVQNPAHEVIGVLRVRYNAAVLQRIVEEDSGLAGRDSFAVLFDENHLHLAHAIQPETLLAGVMPFDSDTISRLIANNRLPQDFRTTGSVTLETGEQLQILNPVLPELEAALNDALANPIFEVEDIATGERINQAAAVQTETQPWTVVYFQPQDVFLAAVQFQTRATVLLSLVIAGAAILAAVWISNLLTAPIIRLTDVAEKVTAGDLEILAQVETEDEIGALASTFNAMTIQIRDLIGSLEERIANRTRDLERRAQYLEAAAEVGKAAAQIHDLRQLLPQVTHQISQRFGFYHAGIFLLDDAGEYAVLKAANSDGGWRMLNRGHRLRVGSEGIVGYVTGTGKPRIARNVGEDAAHFNTPELPQTRSEMALALHAGGRLLGALDVQSVELDAFSEEDVAVLGVLADEVAMAINNAQLFEEVQASLEAERRAYGELSREAWATALHAQTNLNFRSDQHGTIPTDEHWRPAARRAIKQGQSVLGGETGNNHRFHLAVPIKVRETVLGVIDTYKPAEAGEWTRGEIELLESVAEQLGLALENARLFDETQRIARHERIVSDVSSQVWSSSDIETILRTTVQELGRALNASESTIRLNIDNASSSVDKEAQLLEIDQLPEIDYD